VSRTFVEFPSDTDFILTKLDAPSDGQVIISRRSGWDRPQLDTVQHDGAEQAEAFIDERSQALVASGAIEVAPARYLASPGGQHAAIHPPAGRWLGYRLGEGELARHFMELLDTPILAMKRYRDRLEYWVEEERFRDVQRTDRPGGSKIAYCERGMLRRVRTRHGRGANRTYLFRSDDGSCHCVEIREEGRIVEVFMKASHGWQRQRFDDPATEDWTRCEFYDEAGCIDHVGEREGSDVQVSIYVPGRLREPSADGGALMRRGAMLDGERHGGWEFFDRAGSAIRTEQYDKGTEVASEVLGDAIAALRSPSVALFDHDSRKTAIYVPVEGECGYDTVGHDSGGVSRSPSFDSHAEALEGFVAHIYRVLGKRGRIDAEPGPEVCAGDDGRTLVLNIERMEYPRGRGAYTTVRSGRLERADGKTAMAFSYRQAGGLGPDWFVQFEAYDGERSVYRSTLSGDDWGPGIHETQAKLGRHGPWYALGGGGRLEVAGHGDESILRAEHPRPVSGRPDPFADGDPGPAIEALVVRIEAALSGRARSRKRWLSLCADLEALCRLDPDRLRTDVLPEVETHKDSWPAKVRAAPVLWIFGWTSGQLPIELLRIVSAVSLSAVFWSDQHRVAELRQWLRALPDDTPSVEGLNLSARADHARAIFAASKKTCDPSLALSAAMERTFRYDRDDVAAILASPLGRSVRVLDLSFDEPEHPDETRGKLSLYGRGLTLANVAEALSSELEVLTLHGQARSAGRNLGSLDAHADALQHLQVLDLGGGHPIGSAELEQLHGVAPDLRVLNLIAGPLAWMATCPADQLGDHTARWGVESSEDAERMVLRPATVVEFCKGRRALKQLSVGLHGGKLPRKTRRSRPEGAGLDWTDWFAL